MASTRFASMPIWKQLCQLIDNVIKFLESANLQPKLQNWWNNHKENFTTSLRVNSSVENSLMFIN